MFQVSQIRPKNDSYCQKKAIFLTKINQAWPAVIHSRQHYNELKFGLISIHISSFIKISRKMTTLSSKKLIFSTKISQAWPVVTHAYQHVDRIQSVLLSTYISSFIEFGRKMTRLSSEKTIFSTKISQVWPMVNWSPMHINILIDSSQCYYLPTFQVSLRLAKKWPSYHRRKQFFWLKSVRRDP